MSLMYAFTHTEMLNVLMCRLFVLLSTIRLHVHYSFIDKKGSTCNTGANTGNCSCCSFSGKDVKVKGLAAPSNLSMNQTLEGHSGRFYFSTVKMLFIMPPT